jgi:hypothetical protein
MTQSATPSFALDHTMSSFAFAMTQANVIGTHEHAGDFKEP